MSLAHAETPQAASDPAFAETLIRRRLTAAEEYRKSFELSWLMSFAFVAGQQWSVIDRNTRQLHDLSEKDPRYADVDLYVADIIHEHRGAALGELQTDSDRPELIPPGDGEDDETSEMVADQANRLLGHGWDYEWDGDSVLLEARQYCLDLGVSAIRCRFDRMAGDILTGSDGEPVQAPIDPRTGQPIVDPEKAHEHVAGLAAQGQQARFEALHEGRIVWEAGTAFNILAPPGVPHEKKFPWEAWVAPVLLADVKAMFPAAHDLVADSDIASALGLTAPKSGASQVPKVADSVWLYAYYEKPTPQFPQGRTAYLAGSQKKLLQVLPQLPYRRVSGEWCSGIVYLHWQRLTDRFYSRSLIEALKDPQRMTNRVATQSQEIIDRGMPFVLAEEGSVPQTPSGRPMEYVLLKQGTTVQPQIFGGSGPGEWMYRHREQLMQDAQHASTLSSLKLGENPTAVTTYSQLALLYEQEAAKRSTIRVDHQKQVATLAELSMEDVRRYWRDGKQLLIAGEQNKLQAATYEKSMVPELYVVRPAPGSPRPRAQAAQIQLITDLWNAALASGAATLDPQRWMDWLAQSYDAGAPLPLPEPPTDSDQDKADLENRAIQDGATPPVAYYDRIDIHLPLHRAEQNEAILLGDLERWQRGEDHVQQHQAVAAANAAQIAAQAPPPAPADQAAKPGQPQQPQQQTSARPSPAPPPAPPGF